MISKYKAKPGRAEATSLPAFSIPSPPPASPLRGVAQIGWCGGVKGAERAGRHSTEALLVVLSAGLAGIACCGLFLTQWLVQLVVALGGVAGVVLLVQYEAPIALVMAAGSYLGWRLAPNGLIGLAQALLGVVALLTGLLRLGWDLDREFVMAIGPLYRFFVARQTVLALLATFMVVARVAPLAPALLRGTGCGTLAEPRRRAFAQEQRTLNGPMMGQRKSGWPVEDVPHGAQRD